MSPLHHDCIYAVLFREAGVSRGKKEGDEITEHGILNRTAYKYYIRISEVGYTELWTVTVADRDNKAQDEMQADSQHTHQFSVCAAVTAQMSGS